MDELVVITPELGPGAGGVGDYTIRLLETWGTIENPRLIVPPTAFRESSGSGWRVEQLAANREDILKQLPTSGGRILLQYSAYGFDPLGYPRELISALIDWKKKASGRLIVMFHEIWAFWSLTNKNFFIQWFHRRALKRLAESADLVFTSTSSQSEHLRRLSPGMPVRVLPVGSNIQRFGGRNISRRQGWTVLFGRQPTRLRALQKMRRYLNELGAAKQITKIISIGAGSDSHLKEQERILLNEFALSEGFEQCGSAAEEKISETLSSASFGIFAQGELSLEKSGTFMAYAAHELNVLAEFADPAKPAPICWLIAPNELLRGVPEKELRTRAEHLRVWQGQTSSWEIIAREFGEALELKQLIKAHI